MLAQELKDHCLKPEVGHDIGVIAIGEDFWYHIHDNEEIPETLTIALHPRNMTVLRIQYSQPIPFELQKVN